MFAAIMFGLAGFVAGVCCLIGFFAALWMAVLGE